MKVRDPYLSVEVGKKQFKDLKKDLYSKLVTMGFYEIQVLTNPHISVAYIKGQDSISKLKRLLKKICMHPFSMTVKGIKCIESSFYEGTIVSVSLNHSKDFRICQNLIADFTKKDEIKLRKDFPGGFQAHISLFVLKGLSDKDKKDIEKGLSKELVTVGFKKDIKGKKICLYNEDRKIIIEQPLC